MSFFSKTVADLKVRFPSLQEGMKGLLSSEMEKVVREEKFLKEEPERLESALKRCKKLTGTLVTLKRYGFLSSKRYCRDATILISRVNLLIWRVLTFCDTTDLSNNIYTFR